MKKILDFLEQNVQWVVVAVGVLYLGFMAWTFVINSPVSVKIDNETLGPGDVDKLIVDKPVQTLTDLRSRPPKFPIPKLGWADDFKAAMDMSRTKPVELNGKPWVDAIVVALPVGGENIFDVVNAQPIAELPTVPPAVMGPLASGASNVVTPAAPNGVDKNWAVATFKIPNKEIAAAFAEVKLQKGFYSTAVLDVQLMRQELKSDGSWANDTPIAHLPIAKLVPLPGKDAKVDEQKQFLVWAGQNQKEILQPEFYKWLKGDPIDIPTSEAPAVAVPAAPAQAGLPDFDPNRVEYTPDEIKQMTPEQRKQWQKAVKEKEDKERNDRKGKRPPSGRGGGKGGKGGGAAGGGARSVDDGDMPANDLPDDVIDPYNPKPSVFFPIYFQQDRGRGGGGGGRPGGGGMPPGGGRPIPPGPPPVNGAPPPYYPGNPGGGAEPNKDAPATAPAFACPTSFFDPSTPPETWDGWAFDETVQAGRTYRYRVVYSIKSPVFNSPNAVKDKAMANVLAIASTPGEWSKPVKIASRTSFYISSNFADNANAVKFQVFVWQNGAKREKTFEVAPGDMIGGVDNGIDFSTGDTLVDIGRDVRTEKSYVLIADSAGNLTRRNFDEDKKNPAWEEDKRAVAVGAAPPAPVAENR